MSSPLILDISRLLWRARRNVPTGIDRVELEYAKHFIATAADRLDFVAATFTGRTAFLPRRLCHHFVAALDRLWQGDSAAAATARWTAIRLRLALVIGRSQPSSSSAGAAPIYLHVSHHHLDRPGIIRRFKRRSGARFVFMIHDLIPIEWPEYARPGHDRRHTRRMETAAQYADALILNSVATQNSFQPFLDRIGRSIPTKASLLGVASPETRPPAGSNHGPPYFVVVGTIEPRKNHLMLLALWRELALELGASAPRLVLIGQRGWENENVVDLLERSPPVKRTVEERNSVSDSEMLRILSGARAVLMASFTEGYGLPVAEALAAGVPVISTPLPSVREIAGEIPDYRGALDGTGWKAAIIDYMRPDSPRRAAQLQRLASWHQPTWLEHFREVEALLESLD